MCQTLMMHSFSNGTPAASAELLARAFALLHVIMDPTLSAGDVVPWTVTLVAFLVIVQALSAFKGMLPLELLTPVPTPMGDLSFLNVAFWPADAVTVVLVIAGGLTSLVILATSPVIFLTLLGRVAGSWRGGRWLGSEHERGREPAHELQDSELNEIGAAAAR